MKPILLADDEANLWTLVYTILGDPKHRILEATDDPTALELARKEHPGLPVLD